MVTAPTAWAQATDGLLRRVDTLGFNEDRSSPGRHVALSGDTAVVFREAPGFGSLPPLSEVYVFEREPNGNNWNQTTTLIPGDGTPRFGQGATTDGHVIVVGAEGANFVFERAADGQWQEVAKLTGGTAHIGGPTTIFVRSPGAVFVFERTAGRGWQEVALLTGDAAATTFGTSGFAVSGSTVMVGAPGTPGVVYVFEQHHGGAHAWGEVARLTSPSPPPDLPDVFGTSVAIDGDNAIVSAYLDNGDAGAYVFSRDRRRPDTWRQVAALSLLLQAPSTAGVSINRDTAALSSSPRGPSASGIRVFQRNQGGANAWGEVAVLPPSGFNFQVAGISGNLMLVAVGVQGPAPHTRIYSRNQGAKDAWGEVARFNLPLPPAIADPVAVYARALSDDTIFVGSEVLGFTPAWRPTPIAVYVADTDRDGVRDGLDTCPRDPLNNVAGGCQRASTVHPVLDELIAQGDVTSETRGRQHIITATFTNTSDTAVRNPFFEVTELTGGNVLLNGDAGRGGIGATLSPDVGDGVLSPGESMTVTFRIRLRSFDPFQFFVRFHGDAVP
jgi:hypothetical protein